MHLKKGYVHIYTGDGKGKTTAAFGLALRAAGAGMKVFIAQFLKALPSHECTLLSRLSDSITITQYGRDCLIKGEPTDEDRTLARQGLHAVHEALASGKYDLIILDEVTVAVFFKLLSVDDILEVITKKPPQTELVITGRKADPRLIEAADLVTEMKEVKHYYTRGVQARTGIED